MKNKKWLIFILLLVIFIPTVKAEDKPVTYNYEQKNLVDENNKLIGVELTMNLTASDVIAIQHDLEFDSDKLILEEISQNGSFNLTYGEVKKQGGKSTTTIVVDGDYAYSKAPYLKLIFKFTDKFEVNTSAKIRLKNVKAAGLGEVLIKLNGKELSLNMNGENMLSISDQEIDNKFSIVEWYEKNTIYIYIGIGILAIIIICDWLYVKRKNRKQTTPFNTNASFIDNDAKHLRNTFTDTQENENKANGIDPDKYKYHSLILLLITISLFSINIVYAIQGEKNQEIRNRIVGNKVTLKDEQLDISGDKEVNVLDLVLEKNVKEYEIIRINEWNKEFLRNMNLNYIDREYNVTPLEVYSINYDETRHIEINTTYDINAMQCEIGTINNFNKIKNPKDYTYSFDYQITEGKDNCYMQFN